MAAISGGPQYTFDSGGGGSLPVTRREDFADVIYNMAPIDTPLLSILGRRDVQNHTAYDWMVDTIETPTAVRKKPEGGEPTHTDTSRRRWSNVAMFDHVGVSITGHQREANEAGIDDEYGYQLVKKGLELAKQMEFNLRWGEYVAAGDSAAAEPETAGLIQWLTWSAAARDVSGTAVIGPNNIVGATYGSAWNFVASGGLSESAFNTLLGEYWQYGGDVSSSILFAGSQQKRHISDYGVVYGTGSGTAQPLTRMTVQAEKALRAIKIDHYESEFGMLNIVLDRYLDGSVTQNVTIPGTAAEHSVVANETIFGIDPMYHKVGIYRPIQYKPLASTGDYDQAMILASYGYQCGNTLAGFGASNIIA